MSRTTLLQLSQRVFVGKMTHFGTEEPVRVDVIMCNLGFCFLFSMVHMGVPVQQSA